MLYQIAFDCMMRVKKDFTSRYSDNSRYQVEIDDDYRITFNQLRIYYFLLYMGFRFEYRNNILLNPSKGILK